jgi:hypothetical protein
MPNGREHGEYKNTFWHHKWRTNRTAGIKMNGQSKADNEITEDAPVLQEIEADKTVRLADVHVVNPKRASERARGG